ncbi:Transcriptional regulatory protein DegU [Corynebacterium glaucum]|uniref:Transcriptional regulatory protein DegU n=1 Tax=Corynebacterium glaucum TaxID=187491 RepID=A0A1Q2HY20_9CORY|nr:response regulator transcription factor [Corynebacterium glaucum]AQQ15767.1 Transcriptional regulatory protein DegU [Corynebacterium glaucum]
MATTALLIDDHDMLLRGLSLILETSDDVEVAATSTDGSKALQLALEFNVDVVVTDAAMPGTDGLAVVQACSPHVPVLVLTTFDDAALVKQLLDAGASGYVLKDVSPEELIRAITAVAQGGMILDPRIARHAVENPQLAILTPTERKVAESVARGLNNQEIAETLFLAEGTVKNHVSALLRKFDARDRTVLALRLAKALGL